MEQLRHRLTNVSPKGQRRSVDQNPLKRSDLDEFVSCYHGRNGGTSSRASKDLQKQVPPGNRFERKESDRFKSFTYEDLIKRDKINLDIFWLKDEALEDSANLPAPEIIAAEIVEDLQAALAQFAEIANDLKK
jgi:type I restriction enzyme M protein